MAEPYGTPATDSFRAARNFATTDPKLLRRKSIDAGIADKWRSVELKQPLHNRTKLLAKQAFGYELLPELPDEMVWLSRSPTSEPPMVFVHDFTGMLWGLAYSFKMSEKLRLCSDLRGFG